MRNELVRLILLEGLNLKLTLDSKFHSLMTGKIVELFPGEKQETYYRASYFDGEGNRQPPCGKFIKRKSVELKALGLRGPKVGVQPDALHNVPGTSSIQSTTNEVPDVEAQAQAQNWLIHGRSPIEEVRRQWDLCFEKRKQDFQKEKDLSTIFQMYPIIQDPKGGVLICSDFERLHPEAERKFYLRFPSLHQKLRKHIEKVGETKAHESIYNEYMGATEGEYKNLLLCSFLPLILQTNYRVKGKWRPSVKEAQMSFILEVQVRYGCGPFTIVLWIHRLLI
nr:uncharacterized protein LOC115254856 [Aedes albopictus]